MKVNCHSSSYSIESLQIWFNDSANQHNKLSFNFHSELREQLRKAKLEEERSLSAMQRAQNKIANLQSELATFKEEGAAQETGKHTKEICQENCIIKLFIVYNILVNI